MTLPCYVDKTVQGELAELIGRHCTVEAYCNDDAATDCLTKCYKYEYLQERSASKGRHTWLHPPKGKERESLMHYLRQKAEDRPNTSACIVLPTSKGTQQPWSNLIKGMELLAQYSSKDRIYRRCQEGGKYAGGNVDVWYDPPKEYPQPPRPALIETAVIDHPSEVCLAIGSAERPDMLFAVAINQVRTNAIVDTGATADFITEAAVQAAALELRVSASKQVTCAGNHLAGILGEAKVPFRMGSYSSTRTMFVVKHLLDGVDIVLGNPWQRDADVTINCKHMRIKIAATNTVLYSLTKSSNQAQDQSDYRSFIKRATVGTDATVAVPISAKQAAKQLKRGAPYILVSVRKEPSPTVSQQDGQATGSVTDSDGRLPTAKPPPHGGEGGQGKRTKRLINRKRESGSKRNSAPKHPTEEGSTVSIENYMADDRDIGSPGRFPHLHLQAVPGPGQAHDPGDRAREPEPTQDDLEDKPGLIPQRKLQSLLEEYADVFPDDLPAGLPPDRGTGHTIVLEPNAAPPYRRNRRMAPPEVELCETYIKDLLDKGFIAPSNSPFGAPVMFVAKPAGGYRVVCDWRALNNLTIKNRYPLPRIDETLDRLGGSSIFSSLDLNSGYFQIRITPEDAHKTAFTTPLGQYEFKVLGQGLANSPATFQSVMNRIFAPHIYKFCVVYLDDIMIYSKTPEEHYDHLEQVLKLLREHRFYAKRSKCSFNQTEIKFLGHLVGKDGLRVDPAKVEVVKNWPIPKDATQVRQFVGLTNYFRKFIQNYSSIASPLMDLTKKGTDFATAWTDVHTAAFEALKTALTTSPVLILPDFTKAFELVSDASLLGTGAVLLQDGKVVAYTSKKFIPAEKNYTTTEQELLGVVTAMQEWRCYFGASDLTLVTDHNPLQYFNTQAVLSRRLARWQEFLAQFEYKWLYRPGRNNVADPLSRSPALTLMIYLAAMTAPRRSKRIAKKHKVTAAANENPPTPPGKEPTAAPAEVPQSPSAQTPLTDIMQRIKEGYKADPTFRRSRTTKDMTQIDGYWFKGRRLVVPHDQALRMELIEHAHNPPYSGHTGRKRTQEHLARDFYWVGMTSTVDRYVKTCDKCQRNKAGSQKPGGLLQPTEIPDKFWECITMDLITQLPMTKSGHDAIAVFVDKLSKMTHIEPCTTAIDAPEFADLMLTTVFRHHGLPKSIISDRDARFTGHFLTSLAERLGFRQRLSTAFHPQTDGQTERMNRVVEDMVRHYVGPYHDDWDTKLALVEFAINNSWQASIDNTPFHAIYGEHPHTPLSLKIRTEVPTRAPASQQWLQEYADRTARAKACIAAAQDRQKAYADRSRRAVKYSLGEHVWLSTKHVHFKQGGPIKFMPKYIGPFKITEEIGPRDPETGAVTLVTACRLDLPANYRLHPVFHVSLLKPHQSDGSPMQGPAPVELDTDGTPIFVAEALIAERMGRSSEKQYLVRWQGYSPAHDTWEKESDILDPDLISAWDKKSRPPVRPVTRPRKKSVRFR